MRACVLSFITLILSQACSVGASGISSWILFLQDSMRFATDDGLFRHRNEAEETQGKDKENEEPEECKPRSFF